MLRVTAPNDSPGNHFTNEFIKRHCFALSLLTFCYTELINKSKMRMKNIFWKSSPLNVIAAISFLWNNHSIMYFSPLGYPLTKFTDFPGGVVLDSIAFTKCGACTTLVERCALLVFGLIIIACFTGYTLFMSILIYSQHTTTMASTSIACWKSTI